MAFTIEQDRERAKLAFALQIKAEIESVRIIDGTFVAKAQVESVEFPLTFLVRHKTEKARRFGTTLSVPVSFGFKVVTKEDTPTEVVRIACRVQADYDLAEGYEPSVEEIEAFSESNAIFNCWPYFREFVQNMLMRMNYPPLAVPFLRLVPKMPKVVKQPNPQGALESGQKIAPQAEVEKSRAETKRERKMPQ